MGKKIGFILGLIGGGLGIFGGAILIAALIIIPMLPGVSMPPIFNLGFPLAFINLGLMLGALACVVAGFVLIKTLNDKDKVSFKLKWLFGPIIAALGGLSFFFTSFVMVLMLFLIIFLAVPTMFATIILGIPVLTILGICWYGDNSLLITSAIFYLTDKGE